MFYFLFIFCVQIDRDDNAHVVLKFLQNDRRVRETVYGHEYKIRAEFTKPNGKFSDTQKPKQKNNYSSLFLIIFVISKLHKKSLEKKSCLKLKLTNFAGGQDFLKI